MLTVPVAFAFVPVITTIEVRTGVPGFVTVPPPPPALPLPDPPPPPPPQEIQNSRTAEAASVNAILRLRVKTRKRMGAQPRVKLSGPVISGKPIGYISREV